MPELPEVETIKRQLQQSLIGQTISSVSIYTDKMIVVGASRLSNIKTGSPKTSQDFARRLRGKKITSLSRRAKYLIIDLSGGLHLVAHLRMSGQLIVLDRASLRKPLLLSLARSAVHQLLPSKHTHVEISFRSGAKLFYNDTRQFGHMRVVDSGELQQVFRDLNLGPEPLALSAQEFFELAALHGRKRAKDFLLNQQIIAGIGNIYADEALFLAKISPLRKIGLLKPAETAALHAAIQAVLREAIAMGGSSIEYFLMTNGAAGKFSHEHRVYAKSGAPCPNCGLPLASRAIGSRTSTYCRRCQK